MKSLSLVKPLIIVTAGLPRAGKTFFASQFSAMFGAPLVSADRIRYELFNNPSHGTDEQAIISRVCDYMTDEMMKTKKTFILDGGMNVRADRSALRLRAHRAGYELLIVWVQTDPTTTKQRAFSTRQRHPGDLTQPLQADAYEKLAKRFTPPHVSESYVVISGKHTYATQARTVLKKMTSTASISRSINVGEHQQAETPEHTPEARRSASQQISVRGDEPERPTRRNLTIN